MELFQPVIDFLAARAPVLGRVVFIVVLALVSVRVLRKGLVRVLKGRLPAAQLALVRTVGGYLLYAIAFTWSLKELGFEPGVLIGAAGVLTVALGFASQTSVSNLISGLFLMAEQPFGVGDVIVVEGITGEVLSIDLLSVKLRTFENVYVRVPNEAMLKSRVTTNTRFPIRRLDLHLSVAYKESIPRTREVLMKVADANPLCLDEPAPLYIFKGFGASGLEIQFCVWAKRENFLALRNSIHEEIKAAFDAADIEIPFPHTSLYAGAATAPFPIRIVDGSAPASAEPPAPEPAEPAEPR